jgi:hypothetical protein
MVLEKEGGGISPTPQQTKEVSRFESVSNRVPECGRNFDLFMQTSFLSISQHIPFHNGEITRKCMRLCAVYYRICCRPMVFNIATLKN